MSCLLHPFCCTGIWAQPVEFDIHSEVWTFSYLGTPPETVASHFFLSLSPKSSFLGAMSAKSEKNREQDYSPFGQRAKRVKSLSIQSPLCHLPNWCHDSCIIIVMVIDRQKENNASKQRQHMQLCICHHYLLLTSAIITELDSIFDVSKKSKRKSIFDQHLAWHVFATHHSICLKFCQHLHMSFQSFQKLVGLLNDSLLVDQEMASLCGGAIIPELCVYITLQYLAGGSYTDIFFLIGISQSSLSPTMEDN